MLTIPFGSFDSDLDSVLYIKDYDETREKLLDSVLVSKQNFNTGFRRPNKVVINVGGFKHEILLSKLLTRDIPVSRLTRLLDAKSNQEILELCDDYDDNEFYFDRNNAYFETILNYYRTRDLHLLENTCVIAFKKELEYWEINENLIDQCCYSKYMSKKEQIEKEIVKDKKTIDKINEIKKKLLASKTTLPTIRERIWNVTENPNTSLIARVSYYYFFKNYFNFKFY
jgi:hypothetical protein